MLEMATGDWYAVMLVVVVFAMCMIVMMILHLQLAARMAVTDAQLHSLATITNIHLGRLEKLMEGKREKEEIEEMMLLTDESTGQGRSQKRTHKIECLVNRLLEELEHKSRERRHSSDASASQRRRSSDASASQRRRSSDASASQAKRSTHHTATVSKPPAVSIPWTCSNSRELEPPPEFSSSELDELLGLHRAGSAHPPSSDLPTQQLTVDEALKMLDLATSAKQGKIIFAQIVPLYIVKSLSMRVYQLYLCCMRVCNERRVQFDHMFCQSRQLQGRRLHRPSSDCPLISRRGVDFQRQTKKEIQRQTKKERKRTRSQKSSVLLL